MKMSPNLFADVRLASHKYLLDDRLFSWNTIFLDGQGGGTQELCLKPNRGTRKKRGTPRSDAGKITTETGLE